MTMATIFCPLHQGDGCKWTGPWSNAKDHLDKTCEFSTKLCICGKLIPRRGFDEHQKMCVHECGYCQMRVGKGQTAAHAKECKRMMNHCRHGCGALMAPVEFKSHDRLCPQNMVPCPIGFGGHAPHQIAKYAVKEHLETIIQNEKKDPMLAELTKAHLRLLELETAVEPFQCPDGHVMTPAPGPLFSRDELAPSGWRQRMQIGQPVFIWWLPTLRWYLGRVIALDPPKDTSKDPPKDTVSAKADGAATAAAVPPPTVVLNIPKSASDGRKGQSGSSDGKNGGNGAAVGSATVVGGGRVRLRYFNFESKWDEWVNCESDRLAWFSKEMVAYALDNAGSITNGQPRSDVSARELRTWLNGLDSKMLTGGESFGLSLEVWDKWQNGIRCVGCQNAMRPMGVDPIDPRLFTNSQDFNLACRQCGYCICNSCHIGRVATVGIARTPANPSFMAEMLGPQLPPQPPPNAHPHNHYMPMQIPPEFLAAVLGPRGANFP